MPTTKRSLLPTLVAGVSAILAGTSALIAVIVALHLPHTLTAEASELWFLGLALALTLALTSIAISVLAVLELRGGSR